MRIGVVAGRGARAQVDRYDEDDYQRLSQFTTLVAQAGCRRFIVHARKAVLGGVQAQECVAYIDGREAGRYSNAA